ncbi:hypothetical protein TBLA_0H01550 [Henningerozyma blattae CBS 6284]|uniref:Chitobiosyldiphosphodolichol beta-mannosyltransferase n=1 Tax=Henningerozyma blattae (strain ATCC 34711 / CBS 6284 / DSM 70876 / NBRC 10599 / NRRL Y-10934 / UCD 77-7) TaxID=1071380 RepID=I2H7U0_HENB6|nr:hypothetical protein TBLA_0H01550 [Tetrapisispora blattae CBS 6284]CCH62442.1 hypothetical protein TBLA_0H01550 [Tetrapisispora blattae CBS 6284]
MSTLFWLGTLVCVYVLVPAILFVGLPYLTVGTKSLRKRAIVYVIGEIGHSPRMCYHALSLSMRGWDVELCGYVEDELPDIINADPNITIHRLPILKNSTKKPNILFMIKKVIFQIMAIIGQLWNLRGSDYLLMQNPPSIPILPLAVIFRLTGCKLIIDWHNLAYSILQLKFKGNFNHPFVLISYGIEYFFSKFATCNLVVTDAMKEYLIQSFGLKPEKIAVLHDRPANQFKPLSEKASRSTLLTNENFIKSYIPKDFDLSKGDKIIVTSTSFTPDEDLGVLIKALKLYEKNCEENKLLPKILCFVTGKGPLKSHYMHEVEKDNEEGVWKSVKIEFVWLKSEDYPKLLQLCDYGVSLHTSSSGLDLPMKILDMFGSGIPVLAMDYPVLAELVTEGKNGLKFSNSIELCNELIKIIKDKSLDINLRKNAKEESKIRWENSWEPAMKELKIIH